MSYDSFLAPVQATSTLLNNSINSYNPREEKNVHGQLQRGRFEFFGSECGPLHLSLRDANQTTRLLDGFRSIDLRE